MENFYKFIFFCLIISFIDLYFDFHGILLIIFYLFNFLKVYKINQNFNRLNFMNINFININFISVIIISFLLAILAKIFLYKILSINIVKFNLTFYDYLKVLLIVPILEELNFRYLYLNDKVKNNTIISIVLNAICFSLAHLFTESNLFIVFFIGVIFNIIYVNNNNIFLNIIMHFFYNLFTILIFDINIYLIIDYKFVIFIIFILISYLLFKTKLKKI